MFQNGGTEKHLCVQVVLLIATKQASAEFSGLETTTILLFLTIPWVRNLDRGQQGQHTSPCGVSWDGNVKKASSLTYLMPHRGWLEWLWASWNGHWVWGLVLTVGWALWLSPCGIRGPSFSPWPLSLAQQPDFLWCGSFPRAQKQLLDLFKA